MAASSGGPGPLGPASSGASLAQVEELLRLKRILVKALPPAADASSGMGGGGGGGVGDGVEDVGGPPVMGPPQISKEAVSAVLDALAALETVRVNKALLAKSRIGLTVGALRRHPNAEVRSRCVALVARWKSCINQASPKPGNTNNNNNNNNNSINKGISSNSSNSSNNNNSNNPDAEAPAATAAAVGGGGGGGGSSPRRGVLLQGVVAAPPLTPTHQSTLNSTTPSRFVGPFTGDTTRDKARSFLWRALVDGLDTAAAAAAAAGSCAAAETGRVAGAIEEALWQRFVVEKQSTKDYNAQLKTLKWNLADPKNPDLNLKVLWGMYTADQLATMTSAELASDEKKREREQQKQESLEACQSDWEVRRMITSGEANEGQFPCFKCRTNKTVYFQMQTRSSDEPMTTFVTCLECGNRWKF
ncbi:hypothetical protein ACSSS7_008097 [Eimeria intestinalis]